MAKLKLFVCTIIMFAVTVHADDNRLTLLRDLPARLISFAYTIRYSQEYLYQLEINPTLSASPTDELEKRFFNLYDLFNNPSFKSRPIALLNTTKYNCWIKLNSNFSCGDPKERQYGDNGYLYISDPIIIEKEEPFLLVVISGISPRRTNIYRLFDNRLEQVYDLFDHKNYPCGITDPGTALFATYGFDIDGDGNFLLTETEGFHWPEMFPKRQFKLEITASTCTLTKVKEWWEE